jgi:arginyl-tRNA--protein-N-Asp/Glu arginylyltransferase
MTQFNLNTTDSIEVNYQNGLLPQRNQKDLWYQESSSRSNLNNFNLTSENRRILRKTENFSFEKINLKDFKYDLSIQKKIFNWIKEIGWDFPISSIKTIFTNHIFNYLYVWKDEKNQEVAYSICYFSDTISHIAYVFYDPKYNHSNLPIRLVIQTIIDSHQAKLNYCYLGRFSPNTGFYKRNMPGFEYFENHQWLTL